MNNETFFNQCFRCATRFESKIHPAITCEKCVEINAKERAVIESAEVFADAEALAVDFYLRLRAGKVDAEELARRGPIDETYPSRMVVIEAVNALRAARAAAERAEKAA